MDKEMKERIANWLEIYGRLHDEGEELDGSELEQLCVVVNGAYDILFDLNHEVEGEGDEE